MHNFPQNTKLQHLLAHRTLRLYNKSLQIFRYLTNLRCTTFPRTIIGDLLESWDIRIYMRYPKILWYIWQFFRFTKIYFKLYHNFLVYLTLFQISRDVLRYVCIPCVDSISSCLAAAAAPVSCQAVSAVPLTRWWHLHYTTTWNRTDWHDHSTRAMGSRSWVVPRF